MSRRVLAWQARWHAYAGGLITAAVCDYRVCVDSGARFGLNEVPIGIAMPAVYVRMLAYAWGDGFGGQGRADHCAQARHRRLAPDPALCAVPASVLAHSPSSMTPHALAPAMATGVCFEANLNTTSGISSSTSAARQNPITTSMVANVE